MNKIAVVFPGQGSQFIGMGKSLCQQFKIAEQVYEEAEEVLSIPLRQICYGGRISELNRITTLFPAIITYGVASYRVFEEVTEIKPDYMAGHSLGEYAALVCSGILNFADAVRLVEKRASLCLKYSLGEHGTMTVIDGLDADAVLKYCQYLLQEGENVYIACYNKETQVVVSGCSQAVMKLEDMVIEAGAQISPMIMMPPFHSPLMQPVVKEMETLLSSISFQEGSVAVIANVDGMPYPFRKEEIIKTLTKHLVSPVMWCQSQQYMQRNGVGTVVEMGAHHYLTKMVQEIIPECKVYSYGVNQDWNLSESSGVNDSRQRDRIKEYIKIVVGTRNYSNNKKDYDEKIIRKYRELEAIQNDRNAIERAEKLLQEILDLKEVPESVRKQYREELEAYQK